MRITRALVSGALLLAYVTGDLAPKETSAAAQSSADAPTAPAAIVKPRAFVSLAPVRQIWISALTTSFKLGWSDSAQAFVQEKTGETLNQVMSRILTEKLGTPIEV